MNITLSADETVIKSAREYAKNHNTSLNALIRNYLKKVSSEKDSAICAEEFLKLSREQAGESDNGFVFDRDSLYDRY